MAIYKVQTRAGLLLSAALAFVLYTIALGAGVLPRTDGDEQGIAFFLFLFSLPTLYFGISCLRQVRAIRMTADGTVVFARALGKTRTAAHRIHWLEGIYKSDYDGKPEWWLRIRYSGRLRERRIDVPEFDGVTVFAAQVQAHNPSVRITGLWPLSVHRP